MRRGRFRRPQNVALQRYLRRKHRARRHVRGRPNRVGVAGGVRRTQNSRKRAHLQFRVVLRETHHLERVHHPEPFVQRKISVLEHDLGAHVHDDVQQAAEYLQSILFAFRSGRSDGRRFDRKISETASGHDVQEDQQVFRRHSVFLYERVDVHERKCQEAVGVDELLRQAVVFHERRRYLLVGLLQVVHERHPCLFGQRRPRYFVTRQNQEEQVRIFHFTCLSTVFTRMFFFL